ncbi:CaiB/BaiF CoA transferase family protein [Variovorax sp. N23]|uniref:CaiB/BaiF CoA transferase family protein n=1 Tax=Variovorax sp. N23 TaxID=2980555 RepID=UPI0021C8B134|nr:CoA transferase [Variovorax sp. N23]MCU4122371.1 CoA transferase [Variovorax sp. N23]
MAGPLNGLRILDMTSVLMGPFATQVLADLGADVIKVEAPEGDTIRHLGPMRNPGMSAGFLHVNRNKRSVVLDVKQSEAREKLLALARTSDVFVSNVRPAALARLGLAYEDFIRVNPSMIYVSLVGYGQKGPYAARAAYDDMIQAVCAIPTLIAQVGDGVPRYVPLAIVDRIVGQAAATATLAAVIHRMKTGEGQSVDIPMFETMVPYVMSEHMAGHTYEPPEGDIGYKRLLAPSRQAYATANGHVCTVLYTTKHWRSFFELVGAKEKYQDDKRLASLAARTHHISELYTEVARYLKTQPTDYWLERLTHLDIPVMPLHTLESLIHDPHLEAVGFFKHRIHPTEGPLIEMAGLGNWSLTPPEMSRPVPRLGEHTDEVLAEIVGQVGNHSAPTFSEG